MPPSVRPTGARAARRRAASGLLLPPLPKAEARALGLSIRPDWRGLAALSTTTPEGWHPVSDGATSNMRPPKHQRATKAWVEGRSRAIADAAARVRSAAGTRGSGIVSLEARDAAVEAARQYEKRTPRPSFNGVYSVNLEYTEEVSA